VEKYIEKSDQPKRERHLQRIVSSVNNLTNILNEFLSVGKIEEGKINVQLKEFDLQSFVSQAIEDMHGILKAGQRILFHHDGESLVMLDDTLLKNIIMNLISNAIKFSPEHSDISISTAVSEHQIEIRVSDKGIGISNEDQEHLMERFFRGSNANNIQGTGLGLHIVSKYVDRMNGRIRYETELNQGTTFYIIFTKTKNNENNSTH
jgi:signal transduction histidine kinase